MQKLPLAKTTDIVVQEADKELLLYDLKINKAFCLNETSTLIYQACDGKTTLDELKHKHKDLSDEMIFFALNQLADERLLENGSEFSGQLNTLSRRKLIKKIGFATLVALPMISVITAPAAVNTLSQPPAPPQNCGPATFPFIVTGEPDCSDFTNICCSKSVTTGLCSGVGADRSCDCICN